MHIKDDSIDVKQGCGLFSSYAPVSVLPASSTTIDILILSIGKENMKKQKQSSDTMTTGTLLALTGSACKRVVSERKKQSKQRRKEIVMGCVVHRNCFTIL